MTAAPRWDLSDLYASVDDPRIAADFAEADRRAHALADAYKGRMAALSGAEMAQAIKDFEDLDEVLARVASYSQLIYAGDVADPEIGRFHQMVTEKVTEISAVSLFFMLELNQIDDAAMEAQLQDPACARWRPWVEATRAFRKHQLPDEMERMLHDKYVVGRAAWSRLFDETLADIRTEIDGEKLTVTETLNRVVDPDPETRRVAALALSAALKDKSRIFAMVLNTLVKDKEIDDRWRQYPRAVSCRNLGNQVEDEVVDALVAAVREAMPRLSHRYYRLKAKWFGVDQLNWWDRNAPLPKVPERQHSWDEARDLVLGAYNAFSPELGAVGQRFFDRPWIDAEPRPGKASGAFAHPVTPTTHPYLLMSFMGKTRDVMTLAHELGHGVHQVLAGDAQGHLLCGAPLTLAETASVFGEMLTFQALLKAESEPQRRRAMLAQKVEDMLNTVVRQIAFYTFEEKLHLARRVGELTPDDFCKLWREVQEESLGDAFIFDDDYGWWWAYISHFVHSPFYVYAYAFGDCLVNALYAVYAEAHDGFAARYHALLTAGGAKGHRELLAPFGLDARDPAFWRKGLTLIEGFIDELEQEPA